jgi:signal transduction histidine kinase
MRQVPDSQIGASADGLAHEYMRNRGGASGGLAGACLKKTRNPTTVKPQRPFNRLAHRNPDTPASADDLGALSSIELGQASLLADSYERHRLIKIVIPQLSEVVTALLCLVTFGFWLRLKDPLYGYFTLAAGTRFVRELDSVFNEFTLPAGWGQLAIAAAVCWFAIFLMMFALRLLGINWRKFENILRSFVVLIAVVLFAFGGGQWASSATIVLHVVAIVFGIMSVGILLPKIGRVPYVESLPLAGAGVIVLVLGVHDVLQRLGILLTDTPRLSPLGMPVLIFTMASILFSRFIRNVDLLERTNRNLELEIAQKSAQLVETLNAHHQMQKNQAVMQERELILREMHDGIGNYLTIALRAAARSVPDMKLLNGVLKTCMLDLRLMIDSLGESDSGADTVATVLGNLRYRMEPVLKSEGIELIWEVQEVEIMTPLTSRNVLNLTRIFQEAITNVIKHAKASSVVMRSQMVMRDDHRSAVISLTDDGKWLAKSNSTSHGLDNMRRRAFQLGGELNIKQSLTGSVVELSLPQERRILQRQKLAHD